MYFFAHTHTHSESGVRDDREPAGCNNNKNRNSTILCNMSIVSIAVVTKLVIYGNANKRILKNQHLYKYRMCGLKHKTYHNFMVSIELRIFAKIRHGIFYAILYKRSNKKKK